MAEEVVISSMREASEVAEDAKVADVKSLFDTHVNDGKVVLVVEGADDKEVYEKVTDTQPPYSNLVLTDTHDMEGMIVDGCLPELQGEDAERCETINLGDIYSELEDISYLKWFNHTNHCGINFGNVTLDLDITAYFSACVANTNNVINVSLDDMYTFKAAHQCVSEKDLCNGHDLFERIYVRAKAAKVSNFSKKPFFRRLRRAYPCDKFVNTSLYQDIRKWEAANGYLILAAG